MKKCTKCTTLKSLEDFGKGSDTALGLKSRCKICTALDNASYREKYRLKTTLRSKACRVTNPRGKGAASKEWAERNPEKRIAHNRLHSAIRRGDITKLPCKVCGDTKAEAHHHLGYSPENWYNIEWLCRKHHRLADRKYRT